METKIPKEGCIDDMIFTIRGQRVMLDRNLAELYEVPTYRLNEAVKRHITRFPKDFMFQLTRDELMEVIANCDILKNLKFSKTNPYAFTEHGVAMLASILNSEKAIEINIEIIRTFVRLRNCVGTRNFKDIEDLRKMLLLHIENCDTKFSEHENAIKDIISALNRLMVKPRQINKIGFIKDE